MPPVPPARRQAATPAPPAATRLSQKHQRFLRLLCSDHPEHPTHGLSQSSFDTLPKRCRLALQRIITDGLIDPWTKRALEAYYASGYKPVAPPSHPAKPGADTWDYTEDARRATRLMDAPDGQISTIMSYFVGLGDVFVVQRIMELADKPELKSGDKVRLEAVRLLFQLKGHLRDEKAQATQATQIVIHTSQEPAIKPTEQPRVIEIDL